MKDFFTYFLGAGAEIEFTNFSLAHFIPVILLLGVIFAIRHFREPIRNWKWEKKIRYVLAFMLILSEMSYY